MNVVICPHPPLLLPGAGGAAEPLADLRGGAVGALRNALHVRPRTVHLVGTAGESWPGTSLPLSLAVGDHLLDLAGWDGERRYHPLPDAPAPDELTDSVVLLLGDGSARRSERAPGHLDPRAEGFDARIERALADGDAAALAALGTETNVVLAAELMAAGTEAFALLGRWGQSLGVTEAELLWAGAPLGVAYWVASWRLGS